MASAEQLLHEAYFAFSNISHGESPTNRRNTRRATKLCNKIIRKYPATMEAGEAVALLQRLGQVAYLSNIKARHQHIPQTAHHQPQRQQQQQARRPEEYRQPRKHPQQQAQSTIVEMQELTDLDWTGLVGLLFTLPRVVLGVVIFFGLFLFGIFGPFLLVPIVLFVVLAGPLKRFLGPAQREEMNNVITRINAFIKDQQRS
jgi:hypothetical protein